MSFARSAIISTESNVAEIKTVSKVGRGLISMPLFALLGLIILGPVPSNTERFYFNVPAESAERGLLDTVTTYQGDVLFDLKDVDGIQTPAIRGLMTACEALRALTQGLPFELVSPYKWTDRHSCLQLPITHDPRSHRHKVSRLDRSRSCQCLFICDIPIPWCEDERGALINNHECADKLRPL